ncbi:MAG TPA: hypothetical protein VLF89_07125 [Candidatus Saccharimonadales bacterium]|nr:hypothetical protein [Candidatus Saccharimonadales bacterium]
MSIESNYVLNRKAMISDEHGNKERHIFATKEDVDAIDGVRQYFGMLLKDTNGQYPALKNGYQISKRALWEHPNGHNIIDAIRASKQFIGTKNAPLKALDICSGTGQTSWALVKEGFSLVKAVELDSFTCDYAIQNLVLAGAKTSVDCFNEDAEVFMQKRIQYGGGEQYDVAFIDPPWVHHVYESEEFSLKSSRPSINSLVSLAAKLTPVIAVRVPQTVIAKEVQTVAESLGMGSVIRKQHVPPEYRGHNPAMAYFVRGYEGHIVEDVTIDLGLLPDLSLQTPQD